MTTTLFSHTISQSLSRTASVGLLGDQNWQGCSVLFKLVIFSKNLIYMFSIMKYFKKVNDWFDVKNVKVPRNDSRERTYAYRLVLDLQDLILNRMKALMSTMRAIGKKSLIPFQKGK